MRSIAGDDYPSVVQLLAENAKSVHERPRSAQLVERSEAWARECGTERIRQFAFGNDAAAVRLMLGHGYRDVRHFFAMAIELDAPPDVPDVPVEVCRDEDAREFKAALDDAFVDHW